MTLLSHLEHLFLSSLRFLSPLFALNFLSRLQGFLFSLWTSFFILVEFLNQSCPEKRHDEDNFEVLHVWKKKKDFLPSYLFDSWLNIQFYFRNISFRILKALLFIFSLLPVPLLSYLWPFWFLIFFKWPLPSFSLKLLVPSLCQTAVSKHVNVVCFGRGGTGQQVISLCLGNMFYSFEKLFWIISLILYTSPFLCFLLEILFRVMEYWLSNFLNFSQLFLMNF